MNQPQSTKFETFIKLMRMTTSDNSTEALVAMRKANAMLKDFGGDWDDLLRGRVHLIADPFTSIPAPAFVSSEARPAPPPPPPPRPAPPPPGWSGQPRPTRRARQKPSYPSFINPSDIGL